MIANDFREAISIPESKKKYSTYRGSSGKAPGGGVFFYASLISDPDPTLTKNIIWYLYEFFNIGNIEKTLFRKFGHPNIWKTYSYYTNLHQFIDVIIKFPVDLC